MKAIHLIQKDTKLRPWPKNGGGGTLQSGYWKVSRKKASVLIGSKIYFHERQLSPSFLGGITTDFESKLDEPWKDRIIFTFIPSTDFAGVKTDKSGWANEKKFII